jgi:hypothetical protein
MILEAMLVFFFRKGNPPLWGRCIMVNDGFNVGGLWAHGIFPWDYDVMKPF